MQHLRATSIVRSARYAAGKKIAFLHLVQSMHKHAAKAIMKPRGYPVDAAFVLERPW